MYDSEYHSVLASAAAKETGNSRKVLDNDEDDADESDARDEGEHEARHNREQHDNGRHNAHLLEHELPLSPEPAACEPRSAPD